MEMQFVPAVTDIALNSLTHRPTVRRVVKILNLTLESGEIQ